MSQTQQRIDQRYMAAAIRFARRHLARTGTNPSVACLLVKDDVIVGRGITAKGGRPHAEAIAIAEAGALTRGATAYVTLEPCAHHGRTPPCAEALVTAAIARVVVAATDPDSRVSGQGNAILRAADIEVVVDILRQQATFDLAGYLSRTSRKRPLVTLKLAISRDSMLGVKGQGQVAITGAEARAQTDILRAHHDAIAVGIGTMLEDDPGLTCRLNGGVAYSPQRFVLDSAARTPRHAKMLHDNAGRVTIVVAPEISPIARRNLEEEGANIMAADSHEGAIALHEFLDDLAARGIASLLVEGGAGLAQSFMEEDLVDRIALFMGNCLVGQNGIKSPIQRDQIPQGFELSRQALYGSEHYKEMIRVR